MEMRPEPRERRASMPLAQGRRPAVLPPLDLTPPWASEEKPAAPHRPPHLSPPEPVRKARDPWSRYLGAILVPVFTGAFGGLLLFLWCMATDETRSDSLRRELDSIAMKAVIVISLGVAVGAGLGLFGWLRLTSPDDESPFPGSRRQRRTMR